MNEYVYLSNQNQSFSKFMSKVFALMFIALMVTGVSAYVTMTTGLWHTFLNGFMSFVPLALQLGLVFYLSARLHTMSKGASTAAFILYSVVTGVTFSTYFIIFGAPMIFKAFIFTAIVFGCMGIIGYTTNADLSRFSSMFRVGLISLIIGGFINIFFHMPMFDFVLCYGGLFLFLALTAFDIQVMRGNYQMSLGDSDMQHRVAVMSALNLYLDFINIFVHVLSIMARNSDN